MRPSATPEFRTLIAALGPYLDDLVLVGGWAHRLMTEHEAATQLAFDPLMTLDADLAGREQLPVRGNDIRQRLLHAGFREELRGEDRPPISEYHLGSEASGLYVEFLVPQHGSGLRRDRTPDDTAMLAGASAQKLRYVDLLLHEPWPRQDDRTLQAPRKSGAGVRWLRRRSTRRTEADCALHPTSRRRID